MVTGDHPWGKADFSDKYFCRYITNSANYFTTRYGISSEANYLFRSILTRDSDCRIALSTLRERVLKIGSFFSGARKQAAVALPMPIRVASSPPAVLELRVVNGMSSIASSEVSETADEDEILALPYVTTAPPKAGPVRILENSSSALHLFEQDIADALSYCDSVSDVDSEGPETPETHAADASQADASLSLSIEALDLDDIGQPNHENGYRGKPKEMPLSKMKDSRGPFAFFSLSSDIVTWTPLSVLS